MNPLDTHQDDLVRAIESFYQENDAFSQEKKAVSVNIAAVTSEMVTEMNAAREWYQLGLIEKAEFTPSVPTKRNCF